MAVPDSGAACADARVADGISSSPRPSICTRSGAGAAEVGVSADGGTAAIACACDAAMPAASDACSGVLRGAGLGVPSGEQHVACILDVGRDHEYAHA